MERPDLTPSFRVKSSFSPSSFRWNTEITALWMLGVGGGFRVGVRVEVGGKDKECSWSRFIIKTIKKKSTNKQTECLFC